MEYSKAKAKLKKWNQEHVLLRFNKLDKSKQEKILSQIEKINLKEVNELYNRIKRNEEITNKEIKNKIEPINYIDKEKLSVEEKKDLFEKGKALLSSGKIAAVTMAGGQGTRLGHNGPKGTYDLGLENHKSLFEILCDNFKKVQKEYNITIPWYIMTSIENNKETTAFFERNNYFGYPKDKVSFFIQGEYPMIDEDGKLLLNEEGIIKEASDGHGGLYIAMNKAGVFEDMKAKGIEYVEVCGVDNVLANMFDEIFLGLYVKEGNKVASKSVAKDYPEEKVGVFCKKNGRPSIIEYTELSLEMANEKDNKGELKYGESNIIIHIYDLKTMENISKNILPFHPAHKKAKYMDKNGNIVVPKKENAYKFEAFIFDAFETLDGMSILRVKREDEFAPIKNADEKKVDCPSVARELYKKYHGIQE